MNRSPCRSVGAFQRTRLIIKPPEKRKLTAKNAKKRKERFPLDEPIPFDLIRKIVKFRVEQNLEKAAAKKKKR